MRKCQVVALVVRSDFQYWQIKSKTFDEKTDENHF
jgi:hypothetical protein